MVIYETLNSTGKILVFWISGRLWEVVANTRGGRTWKFDCTYGPPKEKWSRKKISVKRNCDGFSYANKTQRRGKYRLNESGLIITIAATYGKGHPSSQI